MKKHGQCYFLTYLRPPKKFSHIFSNFWPIFRHLPPLFVALSQKVSCETFQNDEISMYNSNTDSLGLILDVEVFFFSGSLFRSTVTIFTYFIYLMGREQRYKIMKAKKNKNMFPDIFPPKLHLEYVFS